METQIIAEILEKHHDAVTEIIAEILEKDGCNDHMDIHQLVRRKIPREKGGDPMVYTTITQDIQGKLLLLGKGGYPELIYDVEKARKITEESRNRLCKLNFSGFSEIQRDIMKKIHNAVYSGRNKVEINKDHFTEEFSPVVNWLQKLGYITEEYSEEKLGYTAEEYPVANICEISWG